FDTRDTGQLASFGVTKETLADPGWRLAMLEGRRVPTHDFASNLIAEGYAGLLVRSFTKGTTGADLNLVLWDWSGESSSLNVVDDEGRLNRM
ncbi:MAG: RES domain-containing protein, partial [Parvularcula sp.]|nr:RES domain-containing protein [Parvularcula sp.]